MNKAINRSPNGVCVSAVTKYLDGGDILNLRVADKFYIETMQTYK